MTTEEKDKKFELIFQGPADESVETLRRLKGAFVSDLEFPVDEVRRILADAPVTVCSSDSESEITELYKSLKRAGGKVLLVKPKSAEPEPAEDEIVFSLEDEISEEKPKKEPKVYNLDVDVDDVLFNTLESFETEGDGEDEKSEKPGTAPSADDEPLFPNIKLQTTETQVNETPTPETPPPPPEPEEISPPIELSLDQAIEDASKPVEPISLSKTNVEKVAPVKEASPLLDTLSLLELDSPSPEPVVKKKVVESVAKPPEAPSSKSDDFDLSLDLEPPPGISPLKEALTPTSSEEELSPIEEEEDEDDLSISANLEPKIEVESPAPPKSVKEKETPPPPRIAPVGPPPPTGRGESLKAVMQKKKQVEDAPDASLDEDAEIGAKPPAFMREAAMPLICGAVLLILGNIIYSEFLADSSDSAGGLTVSPEMLTPGGAGEDSGADDLNSDPSFIPPERFESKDEKSGRVIHPIIKVRFNDKFPTVVDANITVQLPPPRELTPLEIAQNKDRAPWLTKAQADDFVFSPRDASGDIIGRGPVKLAVDYKGSRVRHSGEAVVRLKVSDSGDLVTGTIYMFHGTKGTPDKESEITLGSDGRFDFAVIADFRSPKVTASPLRAVSKSKDEIGKGK